MTSTAARIADEALSLPEEDRLGVFLRIASSLPGDKSQWAESARRAEEMRTGKVAPMNDDEFEGKMGALKASFRKQA
jgi:hypothetical protein